MQLDAVSETEQRTVARIAGAVAHELNNPLQGILSLVAVMLRECRLDERCQLRMEQIHHGISRLSHTVESLAVVYENLPRPPDRLLPNELLDRFEAALHEHDFQPQVHHAMGSDMHVTCFAPEIVKLAGTVLQDHSNGQRAIIVRTVPYDNTMEFSCAVVHPEPNEAWVTIDQVRGVSGAAILLDEIVRLGKGKVDFRFNHEQLDGIRFYLALQE
jgi:signal transduction histidine kinase